jgi:hypothetical protein
MNSPSPLQGGVGVSISCRLSHLILPPPTGRGGGVHFVPPLTFDSPSPLRGGVGVAVSNFISTVHNFILPPPCGEG